MFEFLKFLEPDIEALMREVLDAPGAIVASSPASTIAQVSDAFRQRLSDELLAQRSG